MTAEREGQGKRGGNQQRAGQGKRSDNLEQVRDGADNTQIAGHGVRDDKTISDMKENTWREEL